MPRGRPRRFDPDRALAGAVTALRREGVRGISFNELARDIGAAKPALTEAFGGKDALIARALERYYEDTGAVAERALEREDPLADALGAYLHALADSQSDPEQPPGCLLASATSDCANLTDGPIRETVDALNARGREAIKARIERTGYPDSEGLTAFIAGQAVALSTLAKNGATRTQLHAFVDRAIRAVD